MSSLQAKPLGLAIVELRINNIKITYKQSPWCENNHGNHGNAIHLESHQYIDIKIWPGTAWRLFPASQAHPDQLLLPMPSSLSLNCLHPSEHPMLSSAARTPTSCQQIQHALLQCFNMALEAFRPLTNKNKTCKHSFNISINIKWSMESATFQHCRYKLIIYIYSSMTYDKNKFILWPWRHLITGITHIIISSHRLIGSHTPINITSWQTMNIWFMAHDDIISHHKPCKCCSMLQSNWFQSCN